MLHCHPRLGRVASGAVASRGTQSHRRPATNATTVSLARYQEVTDVLSPTHRHNADPTAKSASSGHNADSTAKSASSGRNTDSSPHHVPPRRQASRAAAVAAALLIGLVSTTFGATPASAEAAIGYVRLAHLSPDTPKVDVYLNKVGDAVLRAADLPARRIRRPRRSTCHSRSARTASPCAARTTRPARPRSSPPRSPSTTAPRTRWPASASSPVWASRCSPTT